MLHYLIGGNQGFVGINMYHHWFLRFSHFSESAVHRSSLSLTEQKVRLANSGAWTNGEIAHKTDNEINCM